MEKEGVCDCWGEQGGRTFHVERTGFRTEKSTGMSQDSSEGSGYDNLVKSEYL